MSFFAASHRQYGAVVHPDFPRVQMSNLDHYDALPPAQMQPVIQGSTPHPPNHTAQLADRPPNPLPKLGQTRCYWALLSSSLQFLYLDPVLAHHLEDQAGALVGRSLLTFVHPDEQASAQQDLGGVLESRTLHGSVTRVRYSRLSRVRRMLGYSGPGPDWEDADKIALNEDYMAVDIVINWAADGVVLCFIHAVVDLEPRDNDEHDKTGWTNWCGTPYMSLQQVDLLFTQLVHALPQPPSMERVFQILLNESERPLWFSWPADRQQVQGGPVAKDFARLAAEVSIGNTSSEAKTSCTRRYKAQQTMQFGSEGDRDVESIFIPYGSIIFACHKVSPPNGGKNGQYASNSSHYYHDSAYSLPPLNLPPDYHQYPSQPSPSQYPAQHWSAASEGGSQPPYSQWTSQHTPISSSPSVSSMRSSTYPTSQHSHQQQQTQWSPHPSSFMESGGQSGYPFPPSAQYNDTPPAPSPAAGSSPAPSENVVPAPRNNSRRGSKESYTNSGRSMGHPPVGIMKCTSCSVTHSPEWRKGPSGKKDLCNACGLRYARSRAKKEGGATRRKKEKVLNNMSSKSDHSPSASPVNAPFNGARRSSLYDEGSFGVSTPTGSEPFIQPKQTPSPPSSGVGSFTPYHTSQEQSSQGNDPRGSASFAQHPYYSIPAVPGDMSGAPPVLPRLDPALSYSARLSPAMHSPPSPAPTHFAAPSYEREVKREKDHDRIVLPPTPISADGRGHGKY